MWSHMSFFLGKFYAICFGGCDMMKILIFIGFLHSISFSSALDEDAVDTEVQVHVRYRRTPEDYGKGLGGAIAANGQDELIAASDYDINMSKAFVFGEDHAITKGLHCGFIKKKGHLIASNQKKPGQNFLKMVNCKGTIECLKACQDFTKAANEANRQHDEPMEHHFRSRRLLADDYGRGVGGPVAANEELEIVGPKTKQGKTVCNYVTIQGTEPRLLANFFSVNQDVLKTASADPGSVTDSYIFMCSANSPSGTAPPKSKGETLMEALHRLFVADGNHESPFDAFVTRFSKNYFDNPQEKNRRLGMVQLNWEKIKEANSNKTGDDASFGVTEFADMSHSELLKKFTGIMPGGPLGDKISVTDTEAKNLRFPQKLDWAKLGALPAVRQQGACGSCYAFTTADLTAAQSAIESKSLGNVKPLSPRYVQECGGSDAHGCTGGLPSLVMKHLSNCAGCGIPLESCYPYRNGSKTDAKQCNKACSEKHRLKWSQMVDVSGSHEKELIASFLQWGPLLTIIDCSEVWQFYNGSGIIKASQCGQNQNHAVLITGYDYSGKSPHYMIRNSWGEKWGLKGYAKLEAGKNSCGVAKTVVVGCAEKCGDGVLKAKDFLGKSNV